MFSFCHCGSPPNLPASPPIRAEIVIDDDEALAARLRRHVNKIMTIYMASAGEKHGAGGMLALRRMERQLRLAALAARTLRDLSLAGRGPTYAEKSADAQDDLSENDRPESPCPRDPDELREALAVAMRNIKKGKKSLTSER